MRKQASKFAWGDIVEARFQGKSVYEPGKVTGVWPDGMYSINFDNGHKEDNVRVELIRRRRYTRGRSDISKATATSVSAATPKRTDRAVSRPRTNVTNAESSSTVCTSPDTKQQSSSKFLWGDIVETRCQGGSVYKAGKVIGVWPNGTYSIKYEDGSKDNHVRVELIRLIDGKPRRRSTRGSNDSDIFAHGILANVAFSLDDIVEARYMGKRTYYPGKVTAVSPNGSYSILYDDGDKEEDVRAELIRALDRNLVSGTRAAKSASTASSKRKSGVGLVSRAKLTKSQSSSTECVSPDQERKSYVTFSWGDIVEARFQGKSVYQAGKVTGVWPNGTYSIQYESGNKEDSVEVDLIRSLRRSIRCRNNSVKGTDFAKNVLAAPTKHRRRSGPLAKRQVPNSKSSNIVSTSPDSKKKISPRFVLSGVVEARFQGKSVYQPGEIAHVWSNDTFCIDFNIGPKEDHARVVLRKIPFHRRRYSRVRSNSRTDTTTSM